MPEDVLLELGKAIVEKDIEYGSLKITNLGVDVLNGNHKVEGKILADEPKYKVQKETSLNYNYELFSKTLENLVLIIFKS